MKVYKVVLAAAILILILISDSNASENSVTIRIMERKYVSLYELQKKLKFESTFDIVSQKCKIYRESHVAVFNTGFSMGIIDGSIITFKDPIRRRNGDILLPLDAVKSLTKHFYLSSKLIRNKYSFTLKIPKKQKVKYPKQKKYYYNKAGKDRIAFIVIDPGHGGKDPGAIGRGGIREKVITLTIAKDLERYLKTKLKGITIKTTRRRDRFITLAKRTEITNRLLKKNQNGLFISIHVNASISKKISGFETYFLSQNPTNEEARNTAALENDVVVLETNGKSNKKNYGDIDYIEAMMLTTQIQKESSLLAESIQQGMNRKIKKFKSRGVRKADFFVLRGVLMPASLVEVGFITNRNESRYLLKRNYQRKVASGIGDGIIKFIRRYNAMIKK